MNITADLGVWFYGGSYREIFDRAGMVLFELMLEKMPREKELSRRVKIKGMDREDLLVRWLSEMLYFHSRGFVSTGVTIKTLSETLIIADVDLAGFDPDVHQVKREIKAATYHDLKLGPHRSGYRAQVIFDL